MSDLDYLYELKVRQNKEKLIMYMSIVHITSLLRFLANSFVAICYITLAPRHMHAYVYKHTLVHRFTSFFSESLSSLKNRILHLHNSMFAHAFLYITLLLE